MVIANPCIERSTLHYHLLYNEVLRSPVQQQVPMVCIENVYLIEACTLLDLLCSKNNGSTFVVLRILESTHEALIKVQGRR